MEVVAGGRPSHAPLPPKLFEKRPLPVSRPRSRGNSSMLVRLRCQAPHNIYRTVRPRTNGQRVHRSRSRPPNSAPRSREYLIEAEVEKLISAARSGRHGHRDATRFSSLTATACAAARSPISNGATSSCLVEFGTALECPLTTRRAAAESAGGLLRDRGRECGGRCGRLPAPSRPHSSGTLKLKSCS